MHPINSSQGIIYKNMMENTRFMQIYTFSSLVPSEIEYLNKANMVLFKC